MHRRWVLVVAICAIAAGAFALGCGISARQHGIAVPKTSTGLGTPRPAVPAAIPCTAIVPRQAILPVPQWSSPCAQELAQALPAGAR